MAIYPVVKGQKPSTVNAIPSRGDLVEKAQAGPPPSENLVDFGDEPTTESKQPPEPEAQATGPTGTGAPADTSGSNEIKQMLYSTGHPPESDSPLVDFGKDLKKDLPGVKRSETDESQDEFHDAKE